MTTSTRDVALARLAATQHGALSRTQARDIGVDANFVTRRVRSGRFIEVADGVVVVAGSPPTLKQKVMVAVLSCGRGAVASHFTAAWLHGFVTRAPRAPGDVEVATHRQLRRGRLWRTHRSRDLLPHHTTLVDGIPVSSAARTVLDIAGTAPWLAEQLGDRAVREGLMTYRELGQAVVDVARKGRSGVVVCRELVEARLDWSDRSESELEDRFLRVLVGAGVPLPMAQVELRGPDGLFICRADFVDHPSRSVFFLDGYQWHRDQATFWKDRKVRNRLARLGWSVYVYTWWDVELRPEAVAGEVRSALRRAA